MKGDLKKLGNVKEKIRWYEAEKRRIETSPFKTERESNWLVEANSRIAQLKAIDAIHSL